MGFGINLLNNAFDISGFINNKGRARNTHIGFAVHAFFYPNAIGFGNSVIGIHQKIKRQFVLGNKFLMFSSGIRTYPKDFVARFKKALVVIAEVAGFGGTAGGIVFGLKV